MKALGALLLAALLLPGVQAQVPELPGVPLPPGDDTPSPASEAALQAALASALGYLALHAKDATMPREYLLEAVALAGVDPGLWPSPADNILDRLSIPAVGTPYNDPIREIHALTQSGYSPFTFRGQDRVEQIKQAWATSNQGTGQATFTLLALHAAQVEPVDATFTTTQGFLQRSQLPDGGWTCGGLASADCTGFALTALRATDGLLPGQAERAKVFLDTQRLPNGGYPAMHGVTDDVANTQSTIWAVHGYRAIGAQVPGAIWDYLLSMQMADGGFAWRDGDAASNPWATTEVVAGLVRSFHEMPQFGEANPVLPPGVVVTAPALYAVDNGWSAQWTVLKTGTAWAGNPARFAIPASGMQGVHVEATQPGLHYRARLTVEVAPLPDPSPPLGPVPLANVDGDGDGNPAAGQGAASRAPGPADAAPVPPAAAGPGQAPAQAGAAGGDAAPAFRKPAQPPGPSGPRPVPPASGPGEGAWLLGAGVAAAALALLAGLGWALVARRRARAQAA